LHELLVCLLTTAPTKAQISRKSDEAVRNQAKFTTAVVTPMHRSSPSAAGSASRGTQICGLDATSTYINGMPSLEIEPEASESLCIEPSLAREPFRCQHCYQPPWMPD
jgi:hypothetical protein